MLKIVKITSPLQYEMALNRYEEIFQADSCSPEGIEAQQLFEMIEQYEAKEFSVEYDLADGYFYEDCYTH